MTGLNVEVKKISVSDSDQGNVALHWDEAYTYIDQIINTNIENQKLEFIYINPKDTTDTNSITNNINMTFNDSSCVKDTNLNQSSKQINKLEVKIDLEDNYLSKLTF